MRRPCFPSMVSPLERASSVGRGGMRMLRWVSLCRCGCCPRLPSSITPLEVATLAGRGSVGGGCCFCRAVTLAPLEVALASGRGGTSALGVLLLRWSGGFTLRARWRLPTVGGSLAGCLRLPAFADLVPCMAGGGGAASGCCSLALRRAAFGCGALLRVAGATAVTWAGSGAPCSEGSEVGEVDSLEAIALTHFETPGRLAFGAGVGK